MKTVLVAVVGVAAAAIFSSAVAASSIVGTARNDTLRGTAKSDVLNGRAGNDRLFGLAGNDVLVGGTGRDVLTGGPGSDTFRCGPGADVAVAGGGDRIAVDCETVRGLPSVSVADAAVTEGDSGQKSLSLPVALSAASAHRVSVRFATSDATAAAPADYVAASGVVRFEPGETSKTIDISLNGDIDVEPDETFTVTLSSPVNATIAARSATGTIQNEDRPRPRAGRYSGTTSQGRSISFEVAPDLTRLSQLTLRIDLSCPSVGATIPNEELSFGSASLPIALGSWSFGFSVPINEPEVSGNISFNGSLAAPGSASGSFRLDLTINTSAGAISCSTGAVTWSAS